MRGLASLIPQKRGPGDDQGVSPKESVFLIDIDKIHPNPLQPRKEFDPQELKDLAASIREYGILQPLLVTKIGKETSTGRDVEYELIAGERRWRAARMVNLPRVPVVVRKSTTPEKLAISVVENIQRQNLNPIEEARAYEVLNKKFGMSHNGIAEQVGKSRSVITNAIRMLKLPEDLLKAVEGKKIPASHAKYLLTLNSEPDKQKKLFDEMMKGNMDIFEAQSRLWEIQKRFDKPAMRASIVRENPELSEFASKLKNYWEMGDIRVNRFGSKTRVFIEFGTQADLETWVKRVLSS